LTESQRAYLNVHDPIFRVFKRDLFLLFVSRIASGIDIRSIKHEPPVQYRLRLIHVGYYLLNNSVVLVYSNIEQEEEETKKTHSMFKRYERNEKKTFSFSTTSISSTELKKKVEQALEFLY
jgi:hypothetical protein